jgi:hypothetical protein
MPGTGPGMTSNRVSHCFGANLSSMLSHLS